MTTLTTPAEPWRRSWFYCAPGEVMTLVWIVLLHVLAIVGLILLPLPTIPVLCVAFALAFLGGLGTTVGYHRALAHRAVGLNPVIEQLLILFAVLNGSGNPNNWVRMHRLHHATSDREDDISSPHQGGFWWAHLRWLWQADSTRAAKMAPDLGSLRYRMWGPAMVPLLALTLFGGLLWPGATTLDTLSAALWIGPLRLLYSLHVQCTVNSVCHLGPVSGPHGSGRNIWWLAFAHMGHGENWHENHHRRPGDARLGQRWQLDLGWMVIRALSLVGLARQRRSGAAAETEAAPAA
jgi:fatty-acid desaturase